MVKFSIRLCANPYKKPPKNLERSLLKIDRELFPLSERFAFTGAEWVWVAMCGTDIAGYGSMVLGEHREGILDRCGVVPKYRGNKLQQKLIKARERYAERYLEWVRLNTFVSVENTPSIASLERCGFKKREYTPKFVRFSKEIRNAR